MRVVGKLDIYPHMPNKQLKNNKFTLIELLSSIK